MPRDITLTFGDGTTHQYKGVPDDITPDAVMGRAATDFKDKQLTNVDGGNKPERSWGNTAVNFIKELPEGIYETGKGLVKAIANPGETIEGMGASLVSLTSNKDIRNLPVYDAATKTFVERPSNPRMEELLTKGGAINNAIAEKYKNDYGSTKGFKDMLAERPEDILLDISTLASGGAAAVGKVGQTGKILNSVARYTNPLTIVEAPLNAAANLGARGAGVAVDVLSGNSPTLAAGKIARDAAGADLPAVRLANAANPTATAAQAAGGVSNDVYQAIANKAVQPNLAELTAKLSRDEATMMKYGDKLKPAEKIDLDQSIKQSKAALSSAAESSAQAAAGGAAANAMVEGSKALPKLPKASRLVLGSKTYLVNEAIGVLNGILKGSTVKALEQGMATGKSANDLMSKLPAIEQNKLLQFLSSNPQYLTGGKVAPTSQLGNSMVQGDAE